MRFLRHAIAALALGACALHATAALAYPDKPIRLIVPFPPGGGTDALARQVASEMGRMNGWNFVIENRPGAGGNLGVDQAAKSAPDGYTLVIGQTSNLAINPTLYSKLPYDPEKDLTPIGMVAEAPLVLVVATKSPYRTLADVVAASKSKPGSIDVATSGNGTVAHLATEMFQKAAGIKLTHIPYKGAAQGATDLIGGQIDMYMSSVPTLIGHIRSGAMRALAVTSARRSDDLPDVPTFAESGFKDFDAVTWFGLAGPAGLPADVVATLNKALVQALDAPSTRKLFQAQGAAVRSSTPGAFGKLIHDDRIRWGQIVKESGAHID
ncbi:Bug family tripartite tricarboxylate transporter substrate binding protein [Bordetella genomosp. 11]|uniref:LacI family transcriptional regulator n=1 Tax=Bordetella genomosp. 11 TaxID=1416808 RepID=A0A261UNV5_9BORD|nr:tripartite tricarboxylate transporter substrate binding protein [Bordetella genomosp. 11]OZI63052.1 LacI family transcriptional regulator [Bordetella genomosp. 11]